MPDVDPEVMEMGAKQWQRGKNQGEQIRELFIIVSHLVGTVQWMLEHFGLTELVGSDTKAPSPETTDPTVASADGIDLRDAENATNGAMG